MSEKKLSKDEQIQLLTDKVSNMTINQQGFELTENRLREQVRKKLEEIEGGDRRDKGALIFKKLLAVKKELKAVTKNQTNQNQNFKFRGIDQFINALKPLLDKHGVMMIPRVGLIKEAEYKENKKGTQQKHIQIVMEYDFFAEDGSKVTAQIPAEGVDSGDKGLNKALSAALKYCLIQTFTVPTEDMEEADFGNPATEGGTKTVKKAAARTYDRKPAEKKVEEAPKLEVVPNSESNFLAFQEQKRAAELAPKEAGGEEDY